MKRFHTNTWPYLVIAAALAVVMYGVFSSTVAMGDENSYLRLGLQVQEGKIHTLNPYFHLYSVVLDGVHSDPVTAHHLMRVISALSSTIALYFFLSGFTKYLRPLAALMASLVWMVSLINMPTIQDGNMHVISLALALFGCGIFLRHPNLTGWILFNTVWLWCSFFRKEFLLPLLLVNLGVLCWQWLGRHKDFSFFSLGSKAGVASAAFLLFLTLTLLGVSKFEPYVGSSEHLFLGLGQGYASYYKRVHPDAAFNPMTEYSVIFDSTFGSPKSVGEAIRNNPAEILRYFTNNTFNNLSKLPGNLLTTRASWSSGNSLLSRGNALLLVLVIGVGLVCAAKKMLHLVFHYRAIRMEKSPKIDPILLLGFLIMAAVTSLSWTSLVLHVPMPRYLTGFVPLIFFGVGWCFEQVLRWSPSYLWQIGCLLAVLVAFCRPLFIDAPTLNPEIIVLRKLNAWPGEGWTIAGNYVNPLGLYALGPKANCINAFDGLSSDGLTSGSYDVFYSDQNLRDSHNWQLHQDVYDDFEKNPAKYGYSMIQQASNGKSAVYVLNKHLK